MADHGLALQGAQDALLQELLDGGLGELDARARAASPRMSTMLTEYEGAVAPA